MSVDRDVEQKRQLWILNEHVALKSEIKECFARNQKVTEWSDMYTHELLFQ